MRQLSETRSTDVAQDSPPPGEAVRASLERILSSPDFVASVRATRFLRYVVEETLAGRAERIKAFSVAVEVFDRDDTFDAQNDPVVRIEAGRLRRKLEHYYLVSGKSDRVVIEIPKGGYVPTFEWRMTDDASAAERKPDNAAGPRVPERRRRPPWRLAATIAASLLLVVVGSLIVFGIHPFRVETSASPPTGPRIIVLPFTDLGTGAESTLYSAALIDDIVTNLSRYEDIEVLGVQTSRAVGSNADLAGLNRDLAVQYVLEGGVRIVGELVRVTARLLDAIDGAVLWSQDYDHTLTPANLIEIQTRTADEVANALTQPYGVIFRTELERRSNKPPKDLAAYFCTLRYYLYRSAATADKHEEVRDCLERAVAQFPKYAIAWALLSYLYIDEDRFGFNPRPEPRQRALRSAREGVRLDPQNARTLQALMLALLFNGQIKEALQVGDQAVVLNPNDPETMGQVGLVHAMAGSAEVGRKLLEAALDRNEMYSGYYRGVLAMGAYISGDYERALLEIEQVDKRKVPVYSHLVSAMIYAQTGHDEKARAELAEFQRLAPNWIPNLWAELNKRGIPEERQFHVVDGLRKAGATIPPKPGLLPGSSASAAE